MLDSLTSVFEDHIKDLYNAEKQLIKALPKMAKAANAPALAKAFTAHLKETQTHVDRLEKVALLMEFKPAGKKCEGMEGLIKEGDEAGKEEGSEAGIDAALIAAAQKVEHYEISAYGTARALAKQLGNSEVVALLEATLHEEKAADDKLTDICINNVLPELGVESESDEDETDDK